MMPRPFPLESLRALRVTGPDAGSFLQNQLSSDLREVNPARGQLSGWHDPKGRVLAFLRVLPHPEGFVLVMHAGLLETVRQRLRMFVLRARVSLEAGPPVYGLSGAHGDAAGVLAGLALDTAPLSAACSEALSVLRLPGRAGWLLAGELDLDAAPDAAAENAWARAEIEAGLPEVFPETSGEFVAQMINLDRIGAVSFNKGCYPGQEIVARAHHLGRVKRRARVFSAAGAPPPPGEALADAGGAVVRAASADEGCLVMAVVAEDAAGPFALADGRALAPLAPAQSIEPAQPSAPGDAKR
jgi:tRNA-modifying protein YgfZ